MLRKISKYCHVYKCRHAFGIYVKYKNNTTKQDKSWIRKKN